jgi:hypothetical protein
MTTSPHLSDGCFVGRMQMEDLVFRFVERDGMISTKTIIHGKKCMR